MIDEGERRRSCDEVKSRISFKCSGTAPDTWKLSYQGMDESLIEARALIPDMDFGWESFSIQESSFDLNCRLEVDAIWLRQTNFDDDCDFSINSVIA